MPTRRGTGPLTSEGSRGLCPSSDARAQELPSHSSPQPLSWRPRRLPRRQQQSRELRARSRVGRPSPRRSRTGGAVGDGYVRASGPTASTYGLQNSQGVSTVKGIGLHGRGVGANSEAPREGLPGAPGTQHARWSDPRGRAARRSRHGRPLQAFVTPRAAREIGSSSRLSSPRRRRGTSLTSTQSSSGIRATSSRRPTSPA